MKVLILSVTAGNAHNACAKGMKEKLEQNGVTVKVIFNTNQCVDSR